MPAPQNKLTGRWLVLAAAVLWSTSGLFAKSPVLNEWPLADRGMLLAFWRALFAGLVILPFVRQIEWNWRLVPAAFCFAVMNVAFLTAMTSTTAANAIWLQYTAPAWVMLVGVVFLGEKAVVRDYVMMLCALIGVSVIVICEWKFGPAESRSSTGILWSLLAGVAFAGVILSLRTLRDLSGTWVTLVCHFASAAVLAPWVLTHHPLPSTQLTAWMCAFGALQLALPYVLLARGIRTVPSHEASCITLLEPILVPLWVFGLWRTSPGYQPPRWWTAVGGAIILTGLLVRYWPMKRRSSMSS